jgi:hypothetical protein
MRKDISNLIVLADEPDRSHALIFAQPGAALRHGDGAPVEREAPDVNRPIY